MCISLPLPPAAKSLIHCFESFTTSESLYGWTCERCGAIDKVCNLEFVLLLSILGDQTKPDCSFSVCHHYSVKTFFTERHDYEEKRTSY
jgi:hypothetical protein